MKWVSVKDRLPEQGKPVLITYHFGNPAKRYVEEATCYNGQFTSANDEYILGNYKKLVLAWMYLPKAYEGE